MNLPPKSLKFLRLALDPSTTSGERIAASTAFFKCLHKEGFSVPPEAVGAPPMVSVAHSEGDKLEAVKRSLQKQGEKKGRKSGIVPIGGWKGSHVSEVPSSVLWYFRENTAGLKVSFMDEVGNELDARGLI